MAAFLFFKRQENIIYFFNYKEEITIVLEPPCDDVTKQYLIVSFVNGTNHDDLERCYSFS